MPERPGPVRGPGDPSSGFRTGGVGIQAHKRVCDRGGEKDYNGTLSSWDKSYEDGNVLCPHARYPKTSPKYQIALSGGC